MPDRPSDPFDPRYHRPRDPRFDPRDEDPRFDPRERGGRYDPRDRDPRFDPREDPRYNPRGQASRDDRRPGDPPPPPPSAGPPPRRSRGRLIAMLLALAALLLVGVFAYRMTQAGPGEDRLDENAVDSGAEATDIAESRCGSQQTYDLIKREIFRRAAQVRGSDSGAFDRLAAYATVRVQAPVLKRQDEQLGTVVCSGSVALDLPPGVAVVGGRRTLQSEIDYAIQPAADGSGNVATLSGADAIIVPLATLARTGSQSGLPQPQPEPGPESDSVGQPLGNVPPPAPSPRPAPEPARPSPTPQSPEPAPAPAPQTSAARPSFNCANARTRGEIAVCRNDRLATLDRRMAGEFFGAVRSASPEQRALLQRTRGTFLAYRDRCRTDACIAGAYNDRIREIRDIVNDRWSPR